MDHLTPLARARLPSSLRALAGVSSPSATRADATPPAAEPAAAPRWRAAAWPVAVGGVLAAALLLRVWGARHGLPFAYNVDEGTHFVPRAIGLFGHGWNPHYFANPPAFTYVLHAVFAVGFGGRDGVGHAYAVDPGDVFLAARLASALLGVLAVGLLYIAGARLFGRRTGLLAAALLAVAFLPVHYSHLALNDGPALAPVALALVGCGGILLRGRALDFAVAGAGVGLAAATKYTAAIALVALVAAAAARLARPEARRSGLTGLGVGLAVAVAAFVVANPYAVLEYGEFRAGVERQSEASDLGKIGVAEDNGVLYYLWVLGWGLGVGAAVAALVGSAILLARRRWWLAAVLVPVPALFLLGMGLQERYFGRYILPAFPFLCLLAAFWGLEVADAVARRRPGLRHAATAVVALALLVQGLVYAVHNDVLLTRADTRAATRAWMVANLPIGTRVVLEPVVPQAWTEFDGAPPPGVERTTRWVRFPLGRAPREAQAAISTPGVAGRESTAVQFEDYPLTRRPELLDRYRRSGYCWVVTGSTQRDRAFVDSRRLPRAVAYYRALDRQAPVAYRASPYGPGAGPVPFNFDWSFDYYPMAYERPGPVMRVHRLLGGRCGGARP